MPPDRPKREPASWSGVLSRGLNEAVMGFLALLALAFALVPELFTISAAADRAISAAEWVIVGVFALEYAVHLAEAPDRRAYVLNVWRLIDLITIIGPLLSLLPRVSDSLRSSPILRLLRLFRAALFGTRAGLSAARERSRQRARDPVGPPLFSAIRAEDPPVPRPATWDEFLEGAAGRRGGWYHARNLPTEKLNELALAAGLPPGRLESSYADIARSRVDSRDGRSILSIALPLFEKEKGGRVERIATLLVVTPASLVTLSRGRRDVQEAAAPVLPGLGLPDGPFPARMAYALLHAALARHEEDLARIEEDILGYEAVPSKQSTPLFFEETFRLEKDLSSAKADLWKLKSLLSSLAEGRERIEGGREEDRGFLRGLAGEAEGLLETATSLRETLVSLIGLHMNMASFEMNKVMRVLAVVSALGLIPAVIGGMFGMNLEGNPWPLTLPQVSFGVSMGMLLCLYVFFVKGWMR